MLSNQLNCELMNEKDLRVQRTRHLLRDALIGLVNEQGYDNVSIRDITQTAQVGYKTFFRHYTSKEALLSALVDELIGEFRSGILSPDTPDALKKNTQLALEIALANKELYLVLLQSPASQQLLKPVLEMGREDGKWFFAGTKLPEALVASHFANSMLSLIRWWLEEDQAYTAEEMVEYIERLLIQPLQ